MSLQQWAENGWLRPYSTNQKEITDLLAIVERDLADAAGSISSDWRFGIAYNAALKLCTVLLYASGFRPQRTLAHHRTIQSLPWALTVATMRDTWTPADRRGMPSSMTA